MSLDRAPLDVDAVAGAFEAHLRQRIRDLAGIPRRLPTLNLTGRDPDATYYDETADLDDAEYMRAADPLAAARAVVARHLPTGQPR